ncbi:LysR family transcriptional regulator [Kitasatospora paracochleata]|uniref:DNA-binding transcriptional LysR family regulator n=3 Tax=Kitasatospora paracochleata TaxID=58354 RepID=A0ABT1JAL3_9ACTN|nr:LysR family transcriptional regulator [Kitasatospora paracochleata]MCP2314496.1 DNA-binding transcriptional LysR family regulator [Kitasatospora paracochleata]
MELDPRRLRVLHAVAVRGGVMDAARLLHLTPSAVSQQLTQLEREVGQPLVDRSRRRVGLTPAGRLLAARAARIEQELAEARQELLRVSGRASGPVAIAGFSSAICHLLVPALRRLAEAQPDLKPRVVELEGPEALRELRTGGLDLVVAEYDVGGQGAAADPTGLTAAPVADDEYRVVLPADWSPAPGSVRDLADRPWVASPPGTACGRALERISAEYGFTPRHAHTALEFPTVLALVAAGLGAAIVPTLALSGTGTDFVTLPALPVAGHRRIAALRRASGSGPDPLTDAVVTALREAATALGLKPPAGNGS